LGSSNIRITRIDGAEGDVQERIRGLLKALLESELVEAVLVPRALPDDVGYVQTLVTDPAAIAETTPLAPTMPVHASRILSDLTPSESGRIAAVLKPCELRAAIELDKFLQLDLNQVITVGVDCAGAYDVASFAGEDEATRRSIVSSYPERYAAGGSEDAPQLRSACTLCDHPAPSSADISVLFYGADESSSSTMIAAAGLSEEDAAKLPFEWSDGDASSLERHETGVASLVEKRSAARTQVFDDLRETVADGTALGEMLATCIRCHNCMNVCPICYCKECVFESAVFTHRPSHFMHLAERKTTARMPADTMIFHLTRMSHMGTSCVSCGMCESACPADIPVSRLFSMMGGDLQKMFDYVPGMSRSDDPPVKVFKEQELSTTVGGPSA